MRLAILILAFARSTLWGDTLELHGSYTLIGQAASTSRLEESTTGSLDLFAAWSFGASRIDGYVEGNTSLKDDGVATCLPMSNADAGTALHADRTGRFQISELKYSYSWRDDRSVTAGLLDPSAYLDATRINNDENLQFIGASFVNNPTIEFPDYTLGVVGRIGSPGQKLRSTVLLSGTHGIADNPSLSYSQILNVMEDDRGFFAGAEVAWPAKRYLIRAGAWMNSSHHATLEDDSEDASNYGAYAVLGGRWGETAANLRFGLANPDVSLAAMFASASLQWEQEKRILGLAGSYIWASPNAEDGGLSDSSHLECYLKFEIAAGFAFTPSVQYLTNGGFDSPGNVAGEDLVVYSLRIHHVFYRLP